VRNITGESLKIINIILLIGITLINMFCENSKLRHEAGVIYLAVLMILCTWYALTNRPIKKSEKIGLIFLYIIFVLGFLYLFTRNFK